eukprot:3317656-Pleurochrysis_carterae.AAC.1
MVKPVAMPSVFGGRCEQPKSAMLTGPKRLAFKGWDLWRMGFPRDGVHSVLGIGLHPEFEKKELQSARCCVGRAEKSM